jgi:hypothetical protein
VIQYEINGQVDPLKVDRRSGGVIIREISQDLPRPLPAILYNRAES